MSSGHQRITWRRNIAENFNRLNRVHERYRQTTDRQTDRQTDGRRHIANMNMSSRSLKIAHRKYLTQSVTTYKPYCTLYFVLCTFCTSCDTGSCIHSIQRHIVWTSAFAGSSILTQLRIHVVFYLLIRWQLCHGLNILRLCNFSTKQRAMQDLYETQ